MDPARYAVMRDLEPVVESLLQFVRPVADCWQPSDLLPKTDAENWHDEVRSLREEAAELTDEMLVVLVGNVVTEEALPSYLAELNRFLTPEADTGTASHAWARWNRAWTAEEKRHGDVTRTYAFLSGRVNVHSMEVTVQHLIRNGFDTGSEQDPYRGLVYASFQEHATKLAWTQLGRLAGSVGAERLHRICGLVAADEARHERVYATLLREVVSRDPANAVEAIFRSLGGTISMPARLMSDGVDSRLFQHFATVGQRAGVYRISDYIENVEQLIEGLGLRALTLSGDAGEARDRICQLPQLQRSLYETAKPSKRPIPFQWIHGRSA